MPQFYRVKKLEVKILIGLKNGLILGNQRIILKVNSLEELEEINEKGHFLNLPTAIVRDAGLTQLEPGTATCVGIGPAPTHLINKITSELKLF